MTFEFLNRKGQPVKFKTEFDRKAVGEMIPIWMEIIPPIMAKMVGEVGYQLRIYKNNLMMADIAPKKQKEGFRSSGFNLAALYLDLSCIDAEKEPLEIDQKIRDPDYLQHKMHKLISKCLLAALLPLHTGLRDDPEKWSDIVKKVYPDAHIRYLFQGKLKDNKETKKQR